VLIFFISSGKFAKDWENADIKVKQAYGEEFKGNFLRVLELLCGTLSSSPDSVVKAIVEATTLSNPKVYPSSYSLFSSSSF